jgi:quercetin dioxygenase-like cupin family protein
MTDDQLSELAESVFEPAALVDYQDGAIVSRTLLDREAATLTVFAYDADQTVSEHTAPHDAMIEVLDGRATVTIDGTDYELTDGESIVMPSAVPHSVAAPERFKMLLILPAVTSRQHSPPRGGEYLHVLTAGSMTMIR